MKKMNPETLDFLKNKLHLAERYSKLLVSHPVKEGMSFQNDLIEKIIKKKNFDVKYYSKEDFFLLEDTEQFVFKVSVKNCLVEFIITANVGNISFAGNYGFIVYQSGGGAMFKKPAFSSYEELEEILEEGFKIYEDMKSVI